MINLELQTYNLEQATAELVLQAYKHAGSKLKAAELLGIDRNTVASILARNNVAVPPALKSKYERKTARMHEPKVARMHPQTAVLASQVAFEGYTIAKPTVVPQVAVAASILDLPTGKSTKVVFNVGAEASSTITTKVGSSVK